MSTYSDDNGSIGIDFILDNLLNPAVGTLIEGVTDTITGSLSQWLLGLLGLGGMKDMSEDRIFDFIMDNLINPALGTLINGGTNVITGEIGNWLAGLIFPGQGGLKLAHVSQINAMAQQNKAVIVEQYLQLISQLQQNIKHDKVNWDLVNFLNGNNAKLNISDIWNQIVTGSAGISTIIQEIIDEHIDVPAIMNMLASHLFEIVGNSSILTTVTGVLSGLGLNIAEILSGIGKRNVDDKILADLWNEITSGVSTVPQLIQEIITEHINIADIIQMIKDHFLEIVSNSSLFSTVAGVLTGLGIDITSIFGGIGKRDAKLNISDIWNQIVTGSAGISTIIQEIIDEHIDVPAIMNMLASHLFEIIGNSSILTTVTGVLSGLGLNIGDLLG